MPKSSSEAMIAIMKIAIEFPSGRRFHLAKASIGIIADVVMTVEDIMTIAKSRLIASPIAPIENRIMARRR